MEYYADQGWTDGLPVMPVTESYLQEFLSRTARAPDDVVFRMPHLNRHVHGPGRGHQRGDGRLPARVLPGRPRRLGRA